MISEKKNNLPLVALCGRTNVGKSTLFNCLTEKRQALISNIAGTTRDSNLGIVEWNNSAFEIVDTAGIIDWQYLLAKKPLTKDIETQTQKQALFYLNQADLILFLVDAKTGLLPEDKEIAQALKKNPHYNKKVLLVANKVDNFRSVSETAQFNQLGLGEPIPVSATSSMGTGDLLDLVISKIDQPKKNKYLQKEKTDNDINVCNHQNNGL